MDRAISASTIRRVGFACILMGPKSSASFTWGGLGKRAESYFLKLGCADPKGLRGMQETQLRDAEILAIELYLIRHLKDKFVYKRRVRLIKRLKRLKVEKSWDECVQEISDSR